MSAVGFLRYLGGEPELLDKLKDRSKDEVIAAAAQAGHPFTGEEFDAVVWDLEDRLAQHRGEAFDGVFPLWQLLWGRYYLEFLVHDLVPSLEETGLL